MRRAVLALALLTALNGCTMATVYGIAAAAGIASITHDIVATDAIERSESRRDLPSAAIPCVP